MHFDFSDTKIASAKVSCIGRIKNKDINPFRCLRSFADAREGGTMEVWQEDGKANQWRSKWQKNRPSLSISMESQMWR